MSIINDAPAAAKQVDDATAAWRLDANTFNPEPSGYVTLLDSLEYPIYSFMDIPIGESLTVVKASDELDGMEFEPRLAKSIEIILTLNAGPLSGRDGRRRIAEQQLRDLAPFQMVTLTVMALSIAQVPLKAGEGGQTGSASSAPAPAASTDGPTAS